VDDSAASRSAVGRILEGTPGLVVVGAAGDGEEALREVLRLQPDLVVLDLHMPRMDGFTFLRLLMARRPTPVVVVSSQSHRSDVFKALELGALDFVPKPEAGASFDTIAPVLLEKCELLRALRPQNLTRDLLHPEGPAPSAAAPETRVVAIGASTGGPQALVRLLGALPANLPLAFLVAQHMPEKFTAAFAERIGRSTAFSAQEATSGDLVAEGRVLVAPGGRHLEVRRGPDGAVHAVVLVPDAAARRGHCPSVDRLFRSVASLFGPRACGVVLTGMGQDGREGVVALKRQGGLTVAESQESAVVYGMPQAAAESGALDELLPLDRIAERIVRFGRET
jgi:two-component system, chemotaxis family, protein-glutamate methylesterase/glutaminase